MDQQGKENMAAIGKAQRYNGFIVDSVRRHLGLRVLDIGCGVGNTTALLDRPVVVGIDTSDYYLEQFRSRLPHVAALNEDISRRESVARLRSYRFDTLFCSNVLEHIEDDEAALRGMFDVLESDGLLILIVPNYSWLFGVLDENVQHFRRYDRRSLRAKVERAGFRTEREFCINFPGIFWWYLNARLLKKQVMNEWEPGLIDSVVPLVKLADAIVMNRMGLSLVHIARK